jgi:hypothetical protein
VEDEAVDEHVLIGVGEARADQCSGSRHQVEIGLLRRRERRDGVVGSTGSDGVFYADVPLAWCSTRCISSAMSASEIVC